MRKALCVGCNYPSKAFGLAGAVNDAFLIADSLQKNFGFDAENVCVLHDLHPGQKKSMKVEPSKKPTRVNILQRLQWLVRNARPGDVLFFSFSGYGLQVDDMDGYQDEGFDEAILPTDFVDGRDGDYTVIVNSDIHDILMGIPAGCQVTVLMDCDHATSVVDVSGTLDGGLVGGLKYQTYCGLKVHTTKVQLAMHNREVWQEEKARAVKARPRFQPMMEIDNPRKGRLPTRPAMSRSSPVAFCYSAAAHGQTAMEMQMNRVVDGKDVPKQHGVLTWCFVQAVEELRYDCTHAELLWTIRKHMAALKEKDLPRLDQEVLLTFSTPLSNPQTMKVLQQLPLMAGAGRIQVGGGGDGAGKGGVTIVPPPRPGMIAGSGGDAGGTGAGAGGPPSSAGGPGGTFGGPTTGYGGPPPGGGYGGTGGPPTGAGYGDSRGGPPDSGGGVQHADSNRQYSPQKPIPPSGAAAAEEPPPPPPPPPRPRQAQQQQQGPAADAFNQYAQGPYGQSSDPGTHQAQAPRDLSGTSGSVASSLTGLSGADLPQFPGGPHPAPPAADSTGSSAGVSLIPNFFNMPSAPLGNQSRQQPQPMFMPQANVQQQQGLQGLMPPNLLGGNSFQPIQHPSRSHSQQGMSFSLGPGVGGMAIPAHTAPPMMVGAPQMVPVGRGMSGQSFQAYPQQQPRR